ncbi:hypothetical protein [Geosporobacter ferrireducens]|uniref:DUF340 domain-containing protein n=1 Tax=Geosporobacter ferrireducens TaxID=1424294 RepID=A0A1D8GG59_9FIRM|nr:hypothetical protein [Geosporobacter ferrireducens]AOT69873.1 hypothetical protein Gferi_09950 [Geosporobacter ferrireducens]MTI54432.1 hypothetical protein [Geosporobacter ferrireducens]
MKLKEVQEWILLLFIVGICALLGNFIGYKQAIAASIPGMLILIGISLAGMILAKVIPLNIPSIAYIGIIGMLITAPGFPLSGVIVDYTQKVQFMALATPVLAYAGIAIGKSWADFTKLGWRSIVVSLFVMFGTFIGSAVIAQFILKGQGII